MRSAIEADDGQPSDRHEQLVAIQSPMQHHANVVAGQQLRAGLSSIRIAPTACWFPPTADARVLRR